MNIEKDVHLSVFTESVFNRKKYDLQLNMFFFSSFPIIGCIISFSSFFVKESSSPMEFPMKLSLFCSFLLIFFLIFFFFSRKVKKLKEKIIEINKKDIFLAEKIEEWKNEVKEWPVDLVKSTDSKLVKLVKKEGLKPVRMEFFHRNKIEAEMDGIMKGSWGIFSWGGELFGNIQGDITPQFTDPDVILVCIDKDENIFRILCPSRHSLINALRNFFESLETITGFGIESFSSCSISRFFSELNELSGFLNGIHPLNSLEFIRAKLEKPLEERPSITALLAPTKSELWVASQVGCEEQEMQVVIPFSFMFKLNDSIRKILPHSPELIEFRDGLLIMDN